MLTQYEFVRLYRIPVDNQRWVWVELGTVIGDRSEDTDTIFVRLPKRYNYEMACRV